MFHHLAVAERLNLLRMHVRTGLRIGPLDPEPGHIERRKKDQRQKRRDRQAPHDRVGHRTPEHGGRDRNHPQDRRRGREQYGSDTVRGGVDDRIPGVESLRLVRLDLANEDHRIAGDHAGEREHAEDRHETKGFVRDEKRRDDADDTHRRDAQHEEHAAEPLKLEHQHRKHDDEHQGQYGGDRGLRLFALLHASPDTNMVSARQAGVQRRDLRRQRLHDRRGLRARREICLHRHCGQPVPAPDDGIFLAVLNGGNLAQRNRPPVRQGNLERADSRQGRALLGGGPDQDVDQPNSAAHLRRGDAGQDRIHSLGQIL